MKVFTIYRGLLLFIFFSSPGLVNSQSRRSSDFDFRNFYGICWRGTALENLAFARQMKYDCVFYQTGMERDSLSNGLSFYIESPEYMIYDRMIYIDKKYSDREVAFYNSYCATISSKSQFPANLAHGWFFSKRNFSAQLDFRQMRVIDWAVDAILEKISLLQSKNPKFHFNGYAWDVPQLSGDFWSDMQSSGGRQVSLEYWPSTTNNLSVNTFSSYGEGRKEFYKRLFKKTRSKYPDFKIIMEPYKIYEDWLGPTKSFPDVGEIMPDILCQESIGTEFLMDIRRIHNFELKATTMSTCPAYYSEFINRQIASLAATKGSWFSWFGRFGGTGDMPDFKSITQVPPRIKLIRVLTAWENLNKTNLKERFWNGVEYKSTTALVNPEIIALRQPKTNKIFIVFLTKTSKFTVPSGEKLLKAYLADSLMIEKSDARNLLIFKNNKVSQRVDLTGKCIILSVGS